MLHCRKYKQEVSGHVSRNDVDLIVFETVKSGDVSKAYLSDEVSKVGQLAVVALEVVYGWSKGRDSDDGGLFGDVVEALFDIADAPFPGINKVVKTIFEIRHCLFFGFELKTLRFILKFLILSNITRVFEINTGQNQAFPDFNLLKMTDISAGGEEVVVSYFLWI